MEVLACVCMLLINAIDNCPMRSIKKTKGERSTNLKIHDKEVPIVNTTTHLGIQRSSTVKDTTTDLGYT
jgi:hypothetical protein